MKKQNKKMFIEGILDKHNKVVKDSQKAWRIFDDFIDKKKPINLLVSYSNILQCCEWTKPNFDEDYWKYTNKCPHMHWGECDEAGCEKCNIYDVTFNNHPIIIKKTFYKPFRGMGDLRRYIWEEICNISYHFKDAYKTASEKEKSYMQYVSKKYKQVIDSCYVEDRSPDSPYQIDWKTFSSYLERVGERPLKWHLNVVDEIGAIQNLYVPCMAHIGDEEAMEFLSEAFSSELTIEEFRNKNFFDAANEFVYNASSGRGEESPYYTSNDHNLMIFRKYGKDLSNALVDLVHWKGWPDFSSVLIEADEKRVNQLYQKCRDQYFIEYGLGVNLSSNMDFVYRMWKRSKWAYAVAGLDHTELKNLDFTYGTHNVTSAISKAKKWAVVYLVNPNIPQQLLDILHKIEIHDSEMKDPHRLAKINTLYDGFNKKFGRVPRVFGTMAENIEGINVQLAIETFNVKAMRYALTIEGIEIDYQIDFALAFGMKAKEIIKKLVSKDKSIHDFISGFTEVPFKDPRLVDWIVNHSGHTRNGIIHQVAEMWELDEFPKDGSVQEMVSFCEKKQSDAEWLKCQNKHPYLDLKKLRCNIIDSTVINDKGESARILKADDPMQCYLGQLTSCCQRLNGYGEASMMEGLLNPDSGFLVFERGNKVLAQAWIWLTQDRKTLVLDNIELADNRSARDILHLLKAWVSVSSYLNIQMGTGYNEMNHIGVPVNEPLKWFRQVYNSRYTDASNRVWLKKQGKVTI